MERKYHVVRIFLDLSKSFNSITTAVVAAAAVILKTRSLTIILAAIAYISNKTLRPGTDWPLHSSTRDTFTEPSV